MNAEAVNSFISRIAQLAGTRPQATAVIQFADRMTYGELWRDASAAAACLYDRGVRAGDTVALSLEERTPTWLPALTILYALGYLGAVVLPVHPEVPSASRIQLAERFRARWLISSDTGMDVGGAVRIDPGSLDWNCAWARGTVAPRGDAGERPFLYMFTSGTTGDPKICLFPFGLLTAHRLQYSSEIGSSASDCLAGALCWPTKVGLRTLLRMHALGGSFCNMPVPESLRELGEYIREFGLTQLMCSPWQLRRLLASGTDLDPALPRLRALQVGGALISPDEIQAARERVTPGVYAVYAATELGVLAHIRPGDPPPARGAVGRLLPMVQGQAVDDEDHVLAPGSAGRLRFRTPTMPQCYADNPVATAQCFRAGWFYPGDIGTIDADGQVTLRGRKDDVINYGGNKIMPDAIEAILAQHPDIEDVAVVGIPHAMAGEYPVAFAVFRRPASCEGLVRFCQDRMDHSRIPEEIVGVSAIPRNREGKILRGQLCDFYLAAQLAAARSP